MFLNCTFGYSFGIVLIKKDSKANKNYAKKCSKRVKIKKKSAQNTKKSLKNKKIAKKIETPKV